MKTIFFSASQQSGNHYHCLNMTERQYCESLVNLILLRLPPEFKGISNHALNYDRRPDYAAQRSADVYLTIHTNGFNGNARGLEIGTSSSAQDGPLAEAVYKVLEPLTPAADRGIKKYTFWEAVKPVMPSCYIELSFHDNHEDELWLTQNRFTIADGIIQGLANYFGTSLPVPPVERTYTAAEYNAVLAERDAFEKKCAGITSAVVNTINTLKEVIE